MYGGIRDAPRKTAAVGALLCVVVAVIRLVACSTSTLALGRVLARFSTRESVMILFIIGAAGGVFILHAVRACFVTQAIACLGSPSSTQMPWLLMIRHQHFFLLIAGFFPAAGSG